MLLSTLADDLPIAMVVVGAKNECLYVNPAWITLTGQSFDSSLDQGWIQAIHPHDVQSFMPLCETIEPFECRLGTEGANCHWVRVTMSTLSEAQAGSAKRVLGFTDITKIVHSGNLLFESREELRLLAEAMLQLVWSTDAVGRVEYVNTQFVHFTGLTLEDIKDGDMFSVIHPDYFAEAKQRWQQSIEQGQPFDLEYPLRSKAGACRWYIARAVPISNQDGKVVRWVGTATDIDAQKRTVEKLEFVLESANLFSSSLSESKIYEKLALLAVEKFADWCIIYCCEEEENIKTQTIAHKSSVKVDFLARFLSSNPPHLAGELGEVLRKKISIFHPNVAIACALNNDVVLDCLEIIEQLNIHSCIIVPLATESGSVYGAVTLMSSESGRFFEPGDVEVAEMVGRRAASAVQNARALASERKASQRLNYIASASDLLFESFDVEKTTRRLANFIVQDLADFSLVLRLEENNMLRAMAVGHRDPGEAEKYEALLGQRLFRAKPEEQLIARMLEHHLWKEDKAADIWSGVWEYLTPLLNQFDIASTLLIPLYSRGKNYGLLVACYTNRVERQDEEWDMPLFSDLGARTSIAIENGLVYQRERCIADTLQKTLLPASLPKIPGLHFSAQYISSSKECEIGGDWYDAFVLKNGTLVISVGDVMGRGLQAASMMGLARHAIAVTSMHEDDPARVLDKVDFLFSQYHENAMVTAFLAFVDSKSQTIRYANAGHLYPIVVHEGQLQELNESHGLPIGLRSEFEANEVSVEKSLAGVDLLMLYTDGLIESPLNMTIGMRRLHDALKNDAVLRVKDHAKFIRDVCAVKDIKDDIAILTIRFDTGESWSFNADNARAAHDSRSEFVRYLHKFATVDDHILAAELVFGELIGNVVRHAPGPIDVQVEWSKINPVLHVLDRGNGKIGKAQLPQDPLSEGGRGLYIINSISKEVHVEHIEGFGNHVSVVLPVERRLSTSFLQTAGASLN